MQRPSVGMVLQISWNYGFIPSSALRRDCLDARERLLIHTVLLESCSDIALMCACLKNPTFARSCHANFPASECLVHRWRSVLKRSHACVQLLIVVFDCSATPAPRVFRLPVSTELFAFVVKQTRSRALALPKFLKVAALFGRRMWHVGKSGAVASKGGVRY